MPGSPYSSARRPQGKQDSRAQNSSRRDRKGGHTAPKSRDGGNHPSLPGQDRGRSAGSFATRDRARDQAPRGHGRRIHGLGEDPALQQRLANLAPERLADSDLPQDGTFRVHIAPRGLLGPLLEELGDSVVAVRGRAVLARGHALPCWAQNTWTDPCWIDIASISDAARKLLARQRLWRAHLDTESGLNRRTTLIEEALPHVSQRPLVFPQEIPSAPLGAFLLWRNDLVLASAATTSPFADGEVHFVENREDPPGRAYLKLWEAFTILGLRPQPGELCLELGAAPGSWTWVLAGLGASVFSLDKAPLAPHVETLPNVEHCLGSGFAMTPAVSGRVDWLFSDMICYPHKLLGLVQSFVEARAMRHALCTIKFQSDSDHNLVSAFAAIPGAHICHLSCNKHELTWFYTEPDQA